MITGHLATTLVAKKQIPEMPWWMLVFSALLIDIVMFAFVAVGIEKMDTAPEYMGPRIAGAIIDMTYSHDLLPQLFWVGLAGGFIYLISRNRKFAIAAMVLTIAHFASDLISGYGHFVFGTESHPIGTDWYHQNLLAALGVEAVLGAVCVFWFVRNRQMSKLTVLGLFTFFMLSPFVWLYV